MAVCPSSAFGIFLYFAALLVCYSHKESGLNRLAPNSLVVFFVNATTMFL